MASSADRNQPCSCGSGKKHKNCCGRSGATFTKERQKQVILSLVGIAALVLIVALLNRSGTDTGGSPGAGQTDFRPVTTPTSQATTPPPGPAPEGKVWSPEHGHWHDINSSGADGSGTGQSQPAAGGNVFPQPPGETPEGLVWSAEHGHWHDAKTGRAVEPPPGGTYPQPPGDPPPGKVWSPEHGHWHDIGTAQPAGQNP